MKTVNKLLLFISFLSITQLWAQEPNVVVILADDLGYSDISAYRREQNLKVIVETPVLDQIFKEGMHFTDAHTPAALCAPTRYSVMTGKNCYRQYKPYGIFNSYGKTAIKSDDITLGKLMKNAGYTTGFIGKWHVGTDFKTNDGTKVYRGWGGERSHPKANEAKAPDISKIVSNGPKAQGFDYSFMCPGGIQQSPYAVYENEEWYKMSKSSKPRTLSEKVQKKLGFKFDKGFGGIGDSKFDPFSIGPLLAGKAADFIDRSAGKEKPFFMYYCSQAVHRPHTPSDELDGRKIKGSTPSSHLDMVNEIDAQMGLIVKTLKAKGVYDNTVFIFTSDNGGLLVGGSHKAGHKTVGKLRGSKNRIHEGGHRVPFMVRWPGKVKAGVANNKLISATDILGTLAAITNQTLADEKAPDSFNLLPIFKSEPNAPERKFMMIQGGNEKRGKKLYLVKAVYREGKYKLIMEYKNEADYDLLREFRKEDLEVIALFDLDSNLEEKEELNLMNNKDQKERIARMKQAYIDIRYNGTPTKVANR